MLTWGVKFLLSSLCYLKQYQVFDWLVLHSCHSILFRTEGDHLLQEWEAFPSVQKAVQIHLDGILHFVCGSDHEGNLQHRESRLVLSGPDLLQVTQPFPSDREDCSPGHWPFYCALPLRCGFHLHLPSSGARAGNRWIRNCDSAVGRTTVRMISPNQHIFI